MLQKQKNFRQSLFKSMLIIPVLIGLIIVFHQKVYAVISETAEEIGTGTIAPDTTDTLLQQYERLLDKYELKGTSLKDFVKKRSMVTRDDMEKMISIFLLLTPEERAQNRVIFIKNLPPFQKNNISSADLKKWTNGKIYGVWINEKRIPNSSLSSYKSGDFSHVFVSKLSPNAVNYGKHYYQVDLMTNEYYEKYYKDARAKEGKYFMVIGFKKPVTEK